MKKGGYIAIAVGVAVALGIFGGVGSEKEEQNTLPENIIQSDLITENDSKPAIAPQITSNPSLPTDNCTGTAGCYTDYVTRIVDGDTIHTATKKIRLSLTNAPESFEAGFSEATEFTKKLCPVGSKILIDQDDLQRVDQYGRILAKVFCGDKLLNSELLYNGHANILIQYCSKSEFSKESWALRYGCETRQSEIKKPIPQNCDPSYPDVCIPPYPPDLDCGEIPYKNFKVTGSDPHRFDGDKDGIGCES